VPPFDVVYSNNDLTRSLFSQAGYETRRTKAYKPGEYSGTEVRRRIASGGRWRHLVPAPVVQMIEALDGKKRLTDSGLCDRKRR
jgi:nicotinamide-nucleotide adenylyltransferase